MKFSELTLEQWVEWQPYLDTCLLPVTGLQGSESPIEAALALEQLRDWLDHVEVPYYGRVVTYPAYHYLGKAASKDSQWEVLNRYISQLKESGFRFVVIMSSQISFPDNVLHEADLVLTPCCIKDSGEQAVKMHISSSIQKIWSTM